MRTILVLASLVLFSMTPLEAGHRHHGRHQGSKFTRFFTHFSFDIGGHRGGGHYKHGRRYYYDDPYGRHYYKKRKYHRRHEHYHYDGHCPYKRRHHRHHRGHGHGY